MDSPLSTTLGARMSAYLVTSNDFKKQRKRVNRQLKNLRHELGLINSNTKKYEFPKLSLNNTTVIRNLDWFICC